MKNLITANLESGENLTESTNRALRVTRFTIHTGFTIHTIRHHLNYITEKNRDPNLQILQKTENHACQTGQHYLFLHQVDRGYRSMSDGEIANHMIMARTKAEKNSSFRKPNHQRRKFR